MMVLAPPAPRHFRDRYSADEWSRNLYDLRQEVITGAVMDGRSLLWGVVGRIRSAQARRAVVHGITPRSAPSLLDDHVDGMVRQLEIRAKYVATESSWRERTRQDWTPDAIAAIRGEVVEPYLMRLRRDLAVLAHPDLYTKATRPEDLVDALQPIPAAHRLLREVLRDVHGVRLKHRRDHRDRSPGTWEAVQGGECSLATALAARLSSETTSDHEREERTTSRRQAANDLVRILRSLVCQGQDLTPARVTRLVHDLGGQGGTLPASYRVTFHGWTFSGTCFKGFLLDLLKEGNGIVVQPGGDIEAAFRLPVGVVRGPELIQQPVLDPLRVKGRLIDDVRALAAVQGDEEGVEPAQACLAELGGSVPMGADPILVWYERYVADHSLAEAQWRAEVLTETTVDLLERLAVLYESADEFAALVGDDFNDLLPVWGDAPLWSSIDLRMVWARVQATMQGMRDLRLESLRRDGYVRPEAVRA